MATNLTIPKPGAGSVKLFTKERNTEMKRLLMMIGSAAVACGAAVSSFGATTWYVDAENGNDSWNGQAAFADAVPANDVGPKKTLAVFTNLLAKGDTVYVAPGWYTNGVAETHFRFFSNKGNISLISTGSAADTFIGGAIDTSVNQATSPYGCGPAAIVPLKMTGGNNLVRGITICNGRQLAYANADASYGGGAVFSGMTSGDRMVDCVVTNCIANRGGGVKELQYALRCRFTGNYGGEGSHAIKLQTAVNCIFENTSGYAVYNVNYNGYVLNCLFRGNTAGGWRTNDGSTHVYNSVMLKVGSTKPKYKYCDFYNCLFDFDPNVSVSDTETIKGTNGECRVVAQGSLQFNANGSPAIMNAAVDAAVASYYDSNFPSVFDASEKAFDLAGRARTVGDAMDMGAVERQHWYVDAVNGDDANSGKSAAQAFRTLARASTNALMDAGSTVYVAEGVYDEGVVPAEFSGVDMTANRMFAGEGIDFVATGRRAATVVKGASDSGTACGIGPNAVRCCLMHGGSIHGFTLQNGNVNVGTFSDGDQGGGIYSTTNLTSYAYDCEIHHCNAVRGGGASNVTLVRCYVHDTTITVTGVTPTRSTAASGLNSCSAYNTVVAARDVYRGSRFVNCTLTGKCWGLYTRYENCYVGGDGAQASSVAATFTTCVCAGTFKSYTKSAGCITNTPCQFNSRWRAAHYDSPLVNAGDYSLYSSHFPSALSAYRDLDFIGGERVVEGRIDIGASELKPKGASVSFR